MTDQPIDLPSPESLDTAVSIPAVLAAPRRKKSKSIGLAASVTPDAAPFIHPTAAEPAESATEEPIMATNFENVVEHTVTDAGNKAHTFTADMNTRAKEAMEKGTKFFADMNGFTKDNVEALVESGKIAVAGAQTMAQDQAAYVRKQFEAATAAARELAGVKSPTEFVKLQGDYVRQQFDGAVAEMSRSTEAMLKLVGAVAQPISNRVAVAVEKVKLAA